MLHPSARSLSSPSLPVIEIVSLKLDTHPIFATMPIFTDSYIWVAIFELAMLLLIGAQHSTYMIEAVGSKFSGCFKDAIDPSGVSGGVFICAAFQCAR